MLTGLSLTLLMLGRLLLGGAFLVFGIRNIRNIPRLTGVLTGKGLPQPKLLVTIGVGLQVVCGILVAIGFWAALGGAGLIVFCIVAVYLFHPFWEFAGEERTPHLNAWIMNIGLSGAFLLVIATGL